ncbi:MAG TPA: hypothetical protein VJ725_09620 [Thermoanaerobaculia bacterium]|nr:hypothetical protein [Thermoanaerobaculia bacterium]
MSFRKYDDLRARSRELWAFVDSHPVRKIAIDLRQNGGGDFNVGRKYLVDELARRPKLRGFAITGGRECRPYNSPTGSVVGARFIAPALFLRVYETASRRRHQISPRSESSALR